MSAPLSLVTNREPLPGLSLRRWHYHGQLAMLSRPAAHDGVELSFIEDGEATYRVGQRTLTARAGDLVLVPAGADHATGFSPAMRGGAIEIAADRVAAIARACGGIAEPTLLRDEGLHALLRLFVDEAGRDDPSGRLAADALADAIVVRALRAQPADERRIAADRRIREAIDYIHAHFADDVTIAQLAKVAGMSRYHFSRSFRDVTGSSPYQYVQNTRLAAAETMLRRGGRGVTEVAFGCGFNDPSRFARAFRRRAGCSPSAYQRGVAAPR